MLGIKLSFYKETLHKVPVHLTMKPVDTLDIKEIVSQKYIRDCLGDSENYDAVKQHIHRVPLNYYERISLEEICKIRASTFIMLDRSVEDLFENNLNYRLFYKISSSIWRWGHKDRSWNNMVDAYNCIRNFKFHPDFDIRLDHTRFVHERGWSEYTFTFLDGVFAYLIYYKGVHVMTIGFSIMANRQILIQQVQLKTSKGNRWLFKLPHNYLEYVIGCFEQAFPNHRLYIADGQQMIQNYIKYYRELLRETVEKYRRTTQRSTQEYYENEIRYFEEKLILLKKELPRLSEFYLNTGSYTRGKAIVVNNLKHYRLESPKCSMKRQERKTVGSLKNSGKERLSALV